MTRGYPLPAKNEILICRVASPNRGRCIERATLIIPGTIWCWLWRNKNKHTSLCGAYYLRFCLECTSVHYNICVCICLYIQPRVSDFNFKFIIWVSFTSLDVTGNTGCVSICAPEYLKPNYIYFDWHRSSVSWGVWVLGWN